MTCIVLLAEGFEETEAIVPTDILRRAGIDVRLAAVSQDSLVIAGTHGVKIRTDVGCTELAGEIKNGKLPDAVFCPGGMPGSTNLAKNADVVFVLKEAQRHKRIIAAICAAPAVVLAPLGLLNGKTTAMVRLVTADMMLLNLSANLANLKKIYARMSK